MVIMPIIGGTPEEILAEHQRQLDNIQPACTKPCNDCPWRRNSAPGWLGPYDADKWVGVAHSESPIMCHQTISSDNQPYDDPSLSQCRGAAIYRKHVGKLPRHPNIAVGPTDRDTVFATDAEFLAHHTGGVA